MAEIQRTANVELALKQAFLRTDEELVAKNVKSGCTAAVALLNKDKKKLYTANIGDARVVLRY